MQVLVGVLLSGLVIDTLAFRKRVSKKLDLQSASNISAQDTRRECSAHPRCYSLPGDCCPRPDGTMLDCCNQPDKKTEFMDWILSDMVQIDSAKAEKKLRNTQNVLLPAGQEKVVMAFKVGNDKTYFTNQRILMRPKGWLLSSSTKYESIPYTSILNYGMQTGGIFPDMDTEFWFWTKMPSLPYFQLDFRKGAQNADVYQLLKFINSHLLGPDTQSTSLLHDNAAGFTDVWHWLSNNAAEVDAPYVEKIFKEDFPILQNDEFVKKAFKVGRDSTLLTNKRIVRIDVLGISGKKVSYESWPWESVQAYSVETAGFFDDDCEMTIWTKIPNVNMRKFSQDLRGFGAGSPDVLEVQEIFETYVLGADPAQPVFAPWDIPKVQRQNGTAWELLAWLGGDSKQIDAGGAEARLRATTPILQKDEHVELAFMKSEFEKDIVYMTTKRILIADVKKLLAVFDSKLQYMSIPYKSIHAFEAETAATLDFDSHIALYTDINPPPPKLHCVEVPKSETADNISEPNSLLQDRSEDANHSRPNPDQWRIHTPPPTGKPDEPEKPDEKETVTRCTLIPVPGQSKIDFDLRRGTDIFNVQKLLYARVLRGSMPDGALDHVTELHPSIFTPSGLYHWLDGNAKEINPRRAQDQLEGAGPMLQPGETVQKAFTTWRDLTLLTSTRVLIVDIQFVSVLRKIMYTSVPYSSIHAFGIRTGGTFDFDAEIVFYTEMPWLPKIQQDLRRGTSNIPEVQKFLGDKIIGTKPPSLLEETGMVKQETGKGIGDILDWLGSNHGKVDVETAMAQLSTVPPVLLDGEKINLGYKIHKDMTLFTTHRILVVDVADFDLFSHKVEYRTIPYSSLLGFSVHTASWSMDRDEEVVVHTNMRDLKKLEHDIAVGGNDIFDVQMLLSTRVLQWYQ